MEAVVSTVLVVGGICLWLGVLMWRGWRSEIATMPEFVLTWAMLLVLVGMLVGS